MDALQRSIPDLAVVEVCGSGLHQGSGNQYMEDFAWILVPGAWEILGDRCSAIMIASNLLTRKMCVNIFAPLQMLWDALGMLLHVVASGQWLHRLQCAWLDGRCRCVSLLSSDMNNDSKCGLPKRGTFFVFSLQAENARINGSFARIGSDFCEVDFLDDFSGLIQLYNPC